MCGHADYPRTRKADQRHLYFAHHTKYLGKIKLLKLLYLLDFEHFRQTGRSVTGLDYRAWKFGPVPLEVMQGWDQPEPDLGSAISIKPERVIDYVRETVVPEAPFDDMHFTKRELRIMDELAARYRDTYSPDMIDVTHAENGAWAKVWQDGRGMNDAIPTFWLWRMTARTGMTYSRSPASRKQSERRICRGAKMPCALPAGFLPVRSSAMFVITRVAPESGRASIS